MVTWNATRRVPEIVDMPETEAALKELKPFEFQNTIINAIHGKHRGRQSGDMGIDGYWWFTKEPVQVKQSEHVGRNVVDNFETAVRRDGHDSGYIIAFSFTSGAVEEAARAKSEGLTIRLVSYGQESADDDATRHRGKEHRATAARRRGSSSSGGARAKRYAIK